MKYFSLADEQEVNTILPFPQVEEIGYTIKSKGWSLIFTFLDIWYLELSKPKIYFNIIISALHDFDSEN